MGEIVLVISGASGAAYGVRLAEVLGDRVRLVVTDAGRLTMSHECDGLTPEILAERTGAVLERHDDIAARSASGSAQIDAVVICPCSGTTLGKLAAGIGDNLATIESGNACPVTSSAGVCTFVIEYARNSTSNTINLIIFS